MTIIKFSPTQEAENGPIQEAPGQVYFHGWPGAVDAARAEPAPVLPPLAGKYAKLRDDLRAALEIGRAAQAANPEDGGTCNFDAPALYLPRWKAELVEQAAQEAEGRCWKWKRSWAGGSCWIFPPDSGAQANARTRNAEAMFKALQARGYDAIMYYQAD